MRRQRTRKFRIIIRRALAGAATVALLVAPVSASAIEAGGDKTVNCDDNAVLYCGALSTDNLIHKYDNPDGDGKNSHQSIQDIYGYTKFGINKADVDALDSTAAQGTVTKDGNVFLASDTKNPVATGAVTAGRQDMPGSTKVSNGSTTFYTRTPNISFTKDSLDAYVVMKDGVFQFAILSSCGNPIAAKPVQPPKPQPAPTPQVQAPVCTNFDIAPTGDTRTIKVTQFAYNANGATFVSAVINWDVNSGTNTTTTVNDTNQVIGQTHQYNQDATYLIGVIVNFTQNGRNVSTVATATCQKSIEFKPAAQPTVVTVAQITPEQPKALPSTGPGAVVEVFVAVSAAGAAGYYWFQRRRLS